MSTVGYGSTGKVKMSDKFFLSAEAAAQARQYRPNFNTDVSSTFVGNAWRFSLPVQKLKGDDPSFGSDMGDGVPALANRYSLFQFKGLSGQNLNAIDYMDNPNNVFASDDQYIKARNPTASNIIQFFNDQNAKGPIGSGMQYAWSDFLYCKYYGRITNNYMITVRRFAAPVADNIWDAKAYDAKSKQFVDNSQFDLARAVTYMSEASGNKLEEILALDFKYRWEDIESSMQVAQSKANGIQGSKILGVGTTGFSLGSAISSTATVGSGTNSAKGQEQSLNAGYDALKETYPNYIEGPLNVIKNMTIKGQGMDFTHEFTLKFEYDLRAVDTLNPKMALLDIMANILVLTYSNAPWWGGGHRFLGSGNFGSPLGDRKLLESGDLGGYLKSVVGDVGGLMKTAFGDGAGGFSLESVLGGLGDIGGDMLGGWLGENLNSPQGAQAIQALLSGEPTGQWHVTIGNPLNPIAMIGNLTLQDTKMKLVGPLGKDDFPSILEVTMTLKPGRPRDKSDIESMFNCGRGRLYQVPEGFADVLNTTGKEPKKITGYGKSGDDKAFEKAGTGTGSTNKSNKLSESVLGPNWNETSADDIRDTYKDGNDFMKSRFGAAKDGMSNLFDSLVKYTSG
jgi:hypothetical protein